MATIRDPVFWRPIGNSARPTRGTASRLDRWSGRQRDWAIGRAQHPLLPLIESAAAQAILNRQAVRARATRRPASGPAPADR